MQKVWGNRKYYFKAREGSMDLKHPGMKLLLQLANTNDNILDLGCGEGTRLSIVGKHSKKLYGVDISPVAIKSASSLLPKVKFIKSNLLNLPFKDDAFDLVYSAYTFEHLDNPEDVLKESVRVTKSNLVIICPNYGSPNRSSPNYRKSRIIKLLGGFIGDFKGEDITKWQKVYPLNVNVRNYQIDDDTTVEPYIHSLINSIKLLGMKVVYWDVCWNYELDSAKLWQKIFRILALLKIYPFIYWGPHLVVHAVKI